MALDDHVWPAVIWTVNQLVSVQPLSSNPNSYPNIGLAGYSEGEVLGVPDSPFCMVLNEDLDDQSVSQNLGGSDLNVSVYNITLRLLAMWTTDAPTAEHVLMPLIRQVRNTFRQHIKMSQWPGWGAGSSTIAEALVATGGWGYLLVNGVTYRTVDLRVRITEKEPVGYGT